MNKKSLLIILGSIALMVGLFFTATHFYKKQVAEDIGFKAQGNFKSLVPDYAARKGNPEAKVFLVEFFDPQCESCREFHPVLNSIMQEYEGKVQLILRYAAFHGDSIFAIKVLEAAKKQNKYWEALEILFQHQPEWGNHHNPNPELVWNYLPRLGIDIEKIKQDMQDPEIQKIIEQDTKDGQLLEVRQTPTFFVNGKMVQEFGPDYLKQAIEEALKEN
jgi:protein-disulfide isomerase